MPADLHIHTIASDGNWMPEQIGEEAYSRGLRIIAITDHDSTSGVGAAVASSPPGIRVIPGIEISTDYNRDQVHVLGYWLDIDNRNLQEILQELRRSRKDRAAQIVAKLGKLGLSIDYSDVAMHAATGNIGRAHIAQALLDKGYVSTKTEAFNKWIGVDKPAYVERYKITPHQAVSLIREAQGIPVLAHPGLIKDDSIIAQLIPVGLRGLEVVHSEHSLRQQQYYLEMASSLALLPTGGSDCHGPGGKDQVLLGRFSIPEEWVYQLEEALSETE